MNAAILRSSLTTSLARYSRSWGLWVLLLIAPVGARFWIGNEHDRSAVIAVHDMAPVMTSAVLGVTLGIVVSMLLLPVAFIYLRSNVTRRQPWQIEEVTAGSRIAIALGRFAADAVVLLCVLAAMTVAGWLIGWLVLPSGQLDVALITLTLWLIAAPALMGVAAERILFDSVPLLRGGLGEFLFFVLWMTSILAPVAILKPSTGYAYNLSDFAGFVQPLTYSLPNRGADTDLSIGSSAVGAGHIRLDVMSGIESEGYIASRLSWAGIAVLIAALAGLVYTRHRPRIRRQRWRWIARLSSPGAPKPANVGALPAGRGKGPVLSLVVTEMRLIAGGRVWLLLAAVAAASGLFSDFRSITSPAAMLLLAFGLSAHIGRSERSNLLALTRTAALAPTARRAAFVVAGIAWALLIGAPGIVRGAVAGSLVPLELSLITGAVAAAVALVLGMMARSPFAPRLVLLILWYGYLSSARPGH